MADLTQLSASAAEINTLVEQLNTKVQAARSQGMRVQLTTQFIPNVAGVSDPTMSQKIVVDISLPLPTVV